MTSQKEVISQLCNGLRKDPSMRVAQVMSVLSVEPDATAKWMSSWIEIGVPIYCPSLLPQLKKELLAYKWYKPRW